MTKEQKVKKLFAEVFELPRDLVLNLPRIIVIGNTQFYVENHKGVSEYSEHRIRIKITGGEVCVSGENLLVKNVYSDEILIEGNIKEINFRQ